MDEKQRREIIRMRGEAMRAMSEEEMAEMQRKAAPGMRAMSNEEIAKMQADGMANLYSNTKLSGEI